MRKILNPGRHSSMKAVLAVICVVLIMTGCQKEQVKEGKSLISYRLGVLLAYDSPSAREVFQSMSRKLLEYQQGREEIIDIKLKEAHGDVSLLPDQARKLAPEVDLIVAISTPALQAAMIETQNIPIVFSSVANPYIIKAGRTAVDHDPRITGVCSTAPIKQVIELIHQVKPEVRKIGTIWTPSEINSEYYLELMEEAAVQFGLEVVVQPISAAQDLVQAVQILVRQQVEVLFPVSDNTINANFDLIGELAQANRIPLFAAFSTGAEFGACASMGFDFSDIGTKTAELVIRIKEGESPARIPFQYIDRVRFFINQEAAQKQGIKFPEKIIKKADRLVTSQFRQGIRSNAGIGSE
ncbi:MAG TPA: ABC transporter substrate-binding protein [Candidatus Saccharicenans sp.]|jgi:putative ABC transport system substrate-binding protein|nr:ABC transporter substrate-binding protein [Candidatus Saccharicenans sp.]HQO75822.1 ABC transporter substrate-binding protein [Candidatus Saccharicenans sp.]HUM79448.1 ABC transporter substrate-binding protein [Candidatus Saccharicenans sp.]